MPRWLYLARRGAQASGPEGWASPELARGRGAPETKATSAGLARRRLRELEIRAEQRAQHLVSECGVPTRQFLDESIAGHERLAGDVEGIEPMVSETRGLGAGDVRLRARSGIGARGGGSGLGSAIVDEEDARAREPRRH